VKGGVVCWIVSGATTRRKRACFIDILMILE
jgi:hypothetical protein